MLLTTLSSIKNTLTNAYIINTHLYKACRIMFTLNVYDLTFMSGGRGDEVKTAEKVNADRSNVQNS